MIKILYLILFYLIYRITDVILLLVLLVQTILNIFSGEPSQSIKEFGKSLGVYLQQISEFLSYASEEKPFPFSDWPVVRLDKTEQRVAEASPAASASTQVENEPVAKQAKTPQAKRKTVKTKKADTGASTSDTSKSSSASEATNKTATSKETNSKETNDKEK